jgi:hypothetical protein
LEHVAGAASKLFSIVVQKRIWPCVRTRLYEVVDIVTASATMETVVVNSYLRDSRARANSRL